MLRSVFLVSLLSSLVCALGSDAPGPAESCNQSCEKKFDLVNEDACKRGCSRAAAVQLVPVGLRSPGLCEESCPGAYENNTTLVNACKDGCSFYKPTEDEGPGSFIGHILNIFRGLSSGLSGGPMSPPEMPCENGDETPSSEPKKVRVMIIRRFRIHTPTGDEESGPDDMMNGPMGFHPMMSNPFSGMIPFGDSDPSKDLNVVDKSAEHPRALIASPQQTVSDRMSYAFHYMGSHPMVILFTVTLAALCVLLIVQLALECKRRRRANQFQYNQFDQLPTYVEATTIKVPVDSDVKGQPEA